LQKPYDAAPQFTIEAFIYILTIGAPSSSFSRQTRILTGQIKSLETRVIFQIRVRWTTFF
jgi:hypothetical protein